MDEKEKAETGQPTDLGQLARLVRSPESEALTAPLAAGNQAPEVRKKYSTPTLDELTVFTLAPDRLMHCGSCNAGFEYIDYESADDEDFPRFCPKCGRRRAPISIPGEPLSNHDDVQDAAAGER